MHEYAVVEDLVELIQDRARKKGSPAVRRIHLRRDSTFAEGPLRQAFALLTEHTPLQSARLEIEELMVQRTCAVCGQPHTIRADDLMGHVFVCPDCGWSETIDEAHGLELLAVEFE
jgi:Zn finger protein HypA/HybF involved in hydrogenase expression